MIYVGIGVLLILCCTLIMHGTYNYGRAAGIKWANEQIYGHKAALGDVTKVYVSP